MSDAIDAADALSAYLDDELTPDARDAVDARLAEDPEARVELDEVAEVRDLVRGLAEPALPAGFVDDLLVTVGAADPDTGAEDRATAPVVDLHAARSRRSGRARVAVIAATAAAAVALVVAVAIPSRTSANPALATDVRVHQAGAAATGDPVSGLAPLVSPLRFGR